MPSSRNSSESPATKRPGPASLVQRSLTRLPSRASNIAPSLASWGQWAGLQTSIHQPAPASRIHQFLFAVSLLSFLALSVCLHGSHQHFRIHIRTGVDGPASAFWRDGQLGQRRASTYFSFLFLFCVASFGRRSVPGTGPAVLGVMCVVFCAEISLLLFGGGWWPTALR